MQSPTAVEPGRLMQARRNKHCSTRHRGPDAPHRPFFSIAIL